MQNYFRFFLVALVSSVALTACSSADEDAKRQAQIERPADQIFGEAKVAYDKGEFQKATKLFDEVERQHPYSEFATQAQLLSAKAAYEGLRYDDAVIALDRFIDLHPGHPDVDYAHYLKALCYYEQMADVRRDQETTRLALESFDTLIQKFPDSKYARDAKFKRDLTLDHLAGKEMTVGRYYQRRGELNAAINRFRTVIQDHQTTTHVPEALHRLVEIYTTLGLKDEATRVAAVLGTNYPGSRWYQDSFALLDPQQRARIADQRSWVDRTVDSLLKPE